MIQFLTKRRDTLCESRSDERSANAISCKHDGARLVAITKNHSATNELHCGKKYTLFGEICCSNVCSCTFRLCSLNGVIDNL